MPTATLMRKPFGPANAPARAGQRVERNGESPGAPPRGRRTPWRSRVLIFVTCVLVLDAIFGDRGLAQTMRARRDLRRAHQQLLALKSENAGLRGEARRLQQDPRAIEALARQELGLVRRGELLIVVRDVEQAPATAASDAAPVTN